MAGHRTIKVVVLGAGSMGSGIAALLANHGHTVHLLDLDADLVDQAIDRLHSRSQFTDPAAAQLIHPGSFDTDLAQVEDADWVIEAVVEKLEVKRELYARVAKLVGDKPLITSNTSTLQLHQLVDGLPDELVPRFAIVHFFNPPTVMKLVELVTDEKTDAHQAWRLENVTTALGKTVIRARDTPGFIANRIGGFWMAVGFAKALEHKVPFEVADTVFGRPFGVPRTGIFGLFDYIGIQLVPAIWGGLEDTLPADDALHRYPIGQHRVFRRMLELGFTGRTGESGFYRDSGAGVLTEAYGYRSRIDVENFADPALAETTAAGVMRTDSPAGRFARETFLELLVYCCDHAEQIAHDPGDIDRAMELGYGWKKGPFALAEDIGLTFLAQQLDTVPVALARAIDNGGFRKD